MDRWLRRRAVAGLAIRVALALGSVGSPLSPPPAAAAGLPRWTGGIDLYRAGTFTTQQTWLWCTAADVQIIRNIVDHQHDHSAAAQRRYFDDMRRHNRYAIPVSDGVDPAGWAAGLRHYVDGRYRLVASGSFGSALRSAVRNLRLTRLPVGITVSHGNHAWVLTGFTATADPAVTNHFTVTGVRVVGPLWGLQSRSYGYDMRPDTTLTRRQLKGFFTPWHYAGVRMRWEGDWVSIQPLPSTTNRSPATAAPRATASSRDAPTRSPAAAPAPPSTSPSASLTPLPATSGTVPPTVSGASDPPAVALALPTTGTPRPSASPPAAVGSGSTGNVRDPTSFDLGVWLAAMLTVILIAAGVSVLVGRRRRIAAARAGAGRASRA
jgi:hypothetical protein